MNSKILVLAASVAVLGIASASAQEGAVNVEQPAAPVAVQPPPPGATLPPPPMPPSAEAASMAAPAPPPPVEPVPFPPVPDPQSSPMPVDVQRDVGRANPFLPTYSDQEQAQIDREEQRRQDVQAMIPELRQALIPEIRTMIEAERKTESATASRIEGDPVAAALAGDPAAVAPLSGQVPGTDPAAPGIPGVAATPGAAGSADPGLAQAANLEVGRPLPVGNATFIACVDRKALYRDSSGVIFLADKNSTTCAR